jgi:hypothetical protein
MGRRTNRRRRTRESGSAQRRRSTSKITWAAGAAVAILILAAGGIFYSNSQGPDKDLLSSPATQEVGIDLGDQIPEFNLRLVNGTTVNSGELATMKKPAFYFFFATW